MNEGETSSPWDNAVIPHIEYTDAERDLRVRFVTEYLADYNAYLACIRVGFSSQFAEDFSKRFMLEPFVRRLILQKEREADIAEEAETNKRRIMALLFREAHYQGPGSSHSARVSALAKLTALHGMEAPVKSETTVTEIQAVQFYLPENNR